MTTDMDETEMDGYDRFDREYGEDEPDLRSARRTRKPRSPVPPPPEAAMSETEDGPLPMTYTPSRFEEGWLASSLRPFYRQLLLIDVLYHVKGGKEANVYCGLAHPAAGGGLRAVKVYRPRQFRNLRNDKMYREGRPLLTEEGRAVKKTDTRLMRAVGKKTAFGVQAEHTSWLMYEFTTLSRLHAAGGSVPQPYSASENALLMDFCGDEKKAAPTLIETAIRPFEAQPLLNETLRNIELMLELDMIHGDLSAYNILYRDGEITLIDFPQVTNSKSNPHAEFLLQRDVTRVCQYFASHGATCDPDKVFRRLARKFLE